MAVYAVALINIADRAGYERYEAGFMDIFTQHSGRMLAVDEAPVVKEGEWNYTRTVLIEFPDAQTLDDWYHSDAYQQLAQHRFGSSSASVAVIKGLPSASA